MDSFPLPDTNAHLGFHYFPDTLHYREADFQTWIPELSALGASWLVLLASENRAIPESFIRHLISANIQPILHFVLPLSKPPKPEEMKTLFETYAKWGVNYTILFDRPNNNSSWDTNNWSHGNMVERFLDRFIPLAQLAHECGLMPVFPPLQPGGSYWDTTFLQSALESMERRKQASLLDRLIISAYGCTQNKSLNWGSGGPERWPGTRPYLTPSGEEDQIGFRAFDWYQAIAQATVKHPSPTIILGAGINKDPATPDSSFDRADHAKVNLSIAKLMSGETIADPFNSNKILDKISPQVICANFWLLAAETGSPFISKAWFQPEGQSLPVVGVVKQWITERNNRKSVVLNPKGITPPHPIAHYLLVPPQEWGMVDWHLDVIRPFVKKYHPTVGFSLQEASFAERVTVVGNISIFSEDDLNLLRSSGCQVERISGNGTSIATQLAER
jgi:hypothetical protein